MTNDMQGIMLKLIWIFSLSFFAFILWVIYMANTGNHLILFDWVKMIPYGDKLGHFILFGLLTLAINFSLRLKSVNIQGYPIYLGTLLVSVFVLLEELSQFFFPLRTVDAIDLLADCLGILFFTYLTRRIARV